MDYGFGVEVDKVETNYGFIEDWYGFNSNVLEPLEKKYDKVELNKMELEHNQTRYLVISALEGDKISKNIVLGRTGRKNNRKYVEPVDKEWDEEEKEGLRKRLESEVEFEETVEEYLKTG